MTHKKNLLVIITIFLFASLVFYGYFWFFVPNKLQYLFQNWDGPSYVVIAKSFYDPKIINLVNTINRPPEFFSAHFPLYPIFIRIFSSIGYFRAMIIVSQLFSILFIISFYFLSIVLKLKKPLLLAIGLLFISPRWFTVSHIGSSEPIFLFFTTASLYFLSKRKYLPSALCAALAQLARPQGILFFVGIFLYFLYQFFVAKISINDVIRKYLPFLLVPITLALIFVLFQIQYHNFFAFFTSITQFGHLKLIPFSVFFPGNSGWKEIYIFYYLIAFSTVRKLLIKSNTVLYGFIALAFALPLPFLVHEDIGRYALPLLPFVFIAHHRLLSSKNFFTILLIFIPAIIIFSINYALLNLSP